MFNINSTPTEQISVDKIKKFTELVLSKRFPGNTSRQRVKNYPERLNFACPYCGDSTKDNNKKRGNLYVQSMWFRCYNCDKRVDALNFFKDNDVDISDADALIIKVQLMDAEQNRHINKAERADLSIALLGNSDFSKILVTRDEIIEALHLWEIKPNSPQGIYLQKRRQTLDEKFAWDNKGRRLFIFNTDLSGQYVFGVQTRDFTEKSTNKYLTYGIKRIRTDWLKQTLTEEELIKLEEINHLSTIFGILKVDFNRTVTIFEGPMDSFLMDNACATCSTNTEWPFDVGQRQYFQDNDEAGAKLAFKRLVLGDAVFLWRKFIKDNCLRSNKIKDLNDLRILEFVTDKKYNLLNYFSSEKHDLIDIVGNDDTFGQVQKKYNKHWKK